MNDNSIADIAKRQPSATRHRLIIVYVALAAAVLSAVSVHYLDKRAFDSKLNRTKTLNFAVLEFERSHNSLAQYVLTGDTDISISVFQQNRRGATAIGELLASSQLEYERNALKRVLTHQSDWLEKVAKPTIDKRKMLDEDKLSFSDMQMGYFEKDPQSWDNQFEQMVASVRAYE